MEITLPSSIQEDIVLAFALSIGYQQTVVITPASAETLTYDANNNPVQVPAVAEVDGPNPQSPDDFVSAYFANLMIQAYTASQVAAAVAEAQANLATITATATQTVQATIDAAAQSDMAGKTSIQTHG